MPRKAPVASNGRTACGQPGDGQHRRLTYPCASASAKWKLRIVWSYLAAILDKDVVVPLVFGGVNTELVLR